MTSGTTTSQTVLSVLTPPGRGAVAVVAVTGPNAVSAVNQGFLAKNGRPLAQQPLARIVYGHWGTPAGEDLIVCVRAADEVEVHGHGGSQSVAKIVCDLKARGCHEIPWEEWLSRHNTSAIQTEAQIALSQAQSWRTAKILLDQMSGTLNREMDMISELWDHGNWDAAQSRLTMLLGTFDFGIHLTRSWQVVIAGKPNVGKSSLINELVGYERAIVFDQPGTTRDVVTAETIVDGWPVTLSDTAGLHDAADDLEATGIEAARERLASADLIVWVADATLVTASTIRAGFEIEFGKAPLALPEKQLVVLNKIDLVQDGLPLPSDVIATSTKTGEGVDRLLDAITSKLVPDVPDEGSALLFTARQQGCLASILATCQRQDIDRATGLLRELVTS